MQRSFEFYRELDMCLVRDDIVDFAKLLRAKYPTIKFVRINTGENWIKGDATKEGAKVGLQPAHGGHNITYYEPDEIDKSYTAWIEPPDWTPRWVSYAASVAAARRRGHETAFPPERYLGIYELANEPPLSVSIGASYRLPVDPNVLANGGIRCQFIRGDNEALNFYRRALRLLKSICSPFTAVVSRSDPKAKPTPHDFRFWFGFHARRLMLNDPSLRTEDWLRPSDDNQPRRKTSS